MTHYFTHLTGTNILRPTAISSFLHLIYGSPINLPFTETVKSFSKTRQPLSLYDLGMWVLDIVCPEVILGTVFV